MQREIFGPPELKVTPSDGTRGPRLWFRRFVIWPEPGATPIQDRRFGPGLNIIWSPDPTDRSARDGGEAPSGPGHGAGKTLVCRLLRYCLGEPQFASEALRSKIYGAFKDGRVGVEVVVDGEVWVVVRSIGPFPHDVALKGGTLEAAIAPGTAHSGMAPFVEMLAERFVTPEVAGLIADTPQRAWLLALAWLMRDQECHFGKATEWRVAGGKSGSPAHGLSVGAATNVVRALICALTPRERRLEAEIEKLDKKREQEARGVERRRWLSEDSRERVLKMLDIEPHSAPAGDLLGPFLRSEAKSRLAQVAMVDATGELASVPKLEEQHEQGQKNVERLLAEITSTEAKAKTAEAVAKVIASESPGLSMSIEDAELPTCPVCAVPIERVLAEGCKLSHKLPDLASLRQRRERNKNDLLELQSEQRTAEEALKQLQGELKDAQAIRNKARDDLRTAQRQRAARTDAWYLARRVGDDVDELEKILIDSTRAEQKVAQLETTVEKRRADVAVERNQHVQVFTRLGAHFDPLVRRLLGRDPKARGRIQHDGNGIQLMVDLGGLRETPAIDLMKVLAFDIATLCRSIEGATKLPALLIHDSPRSSDLGLSIYHELFHLMRELEDIGAVPLFQYIVTTTSRPPDDLVNDERVRMKLNGSPAEARLLGRDL